MIGDLVFTTIDQTLSNVLGVPYSVGSARANLNAGAVMSSYLIFDEFHLFPVGVALSGRVACVLGEQSRPDERLYLRVRVVASD